MALILCHICLRLENLLRDSQNSRKCCFFLFLKYRLAVACACLYKWKFSADDKNLNFKKAAFLRLTKRWHSQSHHEENLTLNWCWESRGWTRYFGRGVWSLTAFLIMFIKVLYLDWVLIVVLSIISLQLSIWDSKSFLTSGQLLFLEWIRWPV